MDSKKQKTRQDLERALKLVKKTEASRHGHKGPEAKDDGISAELQRMYNSPGFSR